MINPEYQDSSLLLAAIRDMYPTSDLSMSYAYAFGMAWACLTPEQQKQLITTARNVRP